MAFRTTQIRFGTGVTISGDLGGLDLSAQTGWSTTEEIKMQAPPASSYSNGVRLCGLHDTPPNAPGKLEFILAP
ncbi:MAG TPA: hypothetical protein VHJ18_25225 [Streptosporangiaceae bacterium]|jgi:hypothetical protein|nr:hypothetical protein [Streptosporangiaceae bacterium]